MEFEYISTPRLKLLKLTPEVYKCIYNNYTDEQLKRFLWLKTDEELAFEKQKYKKGIVTYNYSFTNFQLIEKQTETLIGWCGFHTWVQKHSRAEIGYNLLDDSYKQKGYMSEALKAVIQYGFDVMKLNRVEALVADYNIPSVKLLKNNGFTHEGCLRQHYNVDGKMEDSQMYSLLKHEFNT